MTKDIKVSYHDVCGETEGGLDTDDAISIELHDADHGNAAGLTISFDTGVLGMQGMTVSMEVDDCRSPADQPYYHQCVKQISVTVYGEWERGLIEEVARLYLAKRRLIE